MTLDEMKAELAGLRKARYSGALTVKYQANGVLRETTYRRDSELMAAIADLESRINAGRPMNVTVRGRRGWVAPARLEPSETFAGRLQEELLK